MSSRGNLYGRRNPGIIEIAALIPVASARLTSPRGSIAHRVMPSRQAMSSEPSTPQQDGETGSLVGLH
jgi:hypothetical protein